MKKLLMISAAAALAIPAAAIADNHRGPRADADGDGLVTMAEVDARLGERFAKLDLDGNGAVTTDEADTAREAMKERHAERMKEKGDMMGKRGHRRAHRMGHGQMFQRLDANGDGQVTLAEFKTPALERFAKHDANGDGAIDADERAAAREARKAARGNRGQ